MLQQQTDSPRDVGECPLVAELLSRVTYFERQSDLIYRELNDQEIRLSRAKNSRTEFVCTLANKVHTLRGLLVVYDEKVSELQNQLLLTVAALEIPEFPDLIDFIQTRL